MTSLRSLFRLAAVTAAVVLLPLSRLAAIALLPAQAQTQDGGPRSKPVVGAAVPCIDGKAGGYECRNAELLSFLPTATLATLPNQTLSDLWGWTDSATGREFALVSRWEMTSFVEVTDPVNPKYLGDLEAPFSRWHDIKVYKHYALIAGESMGTYGLQVFDLTQLRDSGAGGGPRRFTETARYTGFQAAHNLAVNPETGYAYAVISGGGGPACEGGLHIIDIHDPLKLTYAGCYTDSLTLDIHDTQCVVYRGPDPSYRGRELCFNAAGNAVSIADVTDKRRPTTVSVAKYPDVGYALQGWLSDDQRYFFLSDAVRDRPDTTAQSRILVFDVTRLKQPALVREYRGAPAQPPRFLTDRDLRVRGHYLYQANYKSGVRLLDISDPTNPREVGYFDTAPADNPPRYSGAWGVYPFFKSGAIAVSSTGEGVFFVRFLYPR